MKWRLAFVALLIFVLAVEGSRRGASSPGTWGDVLLSLILCGVYAGAYRLDHRSGSRERGYR